MARAGRGGDGERQYLRRVRGHRADAGDVQEEGALSMEGLAQNSWAARAYLIAGVCFILALRGLSSPTSSQRGNRFGMIGMVLAVGTTLITHLPRIDAATIDMTTAGEILVAIAIGAAIGLTTARKIAMTAMPQLVAAFHSLVGLAAVLVAAAAFLT